MSTDAVSVAKNRWSRNTFFVFACVGAAVGLGNLWRFPYVAYKNGGGAFFLPYIVCLFLIGIPLCLLEIGLGRWGGGSIAAAYRTANRGLTWVGWWVLLNSMVIVCYYCVVLSWCVQYLVFSLTEAWGSDTAGFFTNTILHLTNGPEDLGGLNGWTVVALLVVWATVFLIVRGGVPGLTRVLIVTVPLPLVILLMMAGRSISLPGAANGVSYLLKPRFGEILNYSVWASAASQVLLSLGLGMGQMVAYSSKKRDDSAVATSAVVICSLDLLFSLLAGIITFAMMGFLATSQGMEITGLKLDGLFLAFVSYPMAISSLPGAPLWGVLFFVLMISLGIDSAFAVIEATLAGAEEVWSGRTRNLLSFVLCSVGFVGGLVFTAGGGLYWLDIVDHWVEKYAIPCLILLECGLFAWVAPIKSIAHRVRSSWHSFPVAWWGTWLRFVLPVVLVVVFGGRVAEEGFTKYGGYPVDVLWIGGWGVCVAVIMLSFVIGVAYNRAVGRTHQ